MPASGAVTRSVIGMGGLREMGTVISRVEPGRTQRDEYGVIHEYAKCGHCGRIWDDALITSKTPTPAGRCPFESEHHYRQSLAERERVRTNQLPPNRGRFRTKSLAGEAARRSRDAKRQGRDRYGRFA